LNSILFELFYAWPVHVYRGADKSLARPGSKQAWKHVRDTHDFNNIETQAVIKIFFLQGKAPKEIHAILTETLACFLPGRAKDLSESLKNKQCNDRKKLILQANSLCKAPENLDSSFYGD